MRGKKRISLAEAEQIGDTLGIDWNLIILKQFRIGLEVELDNRVRNPQSNGTEDDFLITGKIVLEHLKEFPGHYTRLAIMEKEADEYWANV